MKLLFTKKRTESESIFIALAFEEMNLLIKDFPLEDDSKDPKIEGANSTDPTDATNGSTNNKRKIKSNSLMNDYVDSSNLTALLDPTERYLTRSATKKLATEKKILEAEADKAKKNLWEKFDNIESLHSSPILDAAKVLNCVESEDLNSPPYPNNMHVIGNNNFLHQNEPFQHSYPVSFQNTLVNNNASYYPAFWNQSYPVNNINYPINNNNNNYQINNNHQMNNYQIGNNYPINNSYPVNNLNNNDLIQNRPNINYPSNHSQINSFPSNNYDQDSDYEESEEEERNSEYQCEQEPDNQKTNNASAITNERTDGNVARNKKNDIGEEKNGHNSAINKPETLQNDKIVTSTSKQKLTESALATRKYSNNFNCGSNEKDMYCILKRMSFFIFQIQKQTRAMVIKMVSERRIVVAVEMILKRKNMCLIMTIHLQLTKLSKL